MPPVTAGVITATTLQRNPALTMSDVFQTCSGRRWYMSVFSPLIAKNVGYNKPDTKVSNFDTTAAPIGDPFGTANPKIIGPSAFPDTTNRNIRTRTTNTITIIIPTTDNIAPTGFVSPRLAVST